MEIKEQMGMVNDYIGFTPVNYIARDGYVVGFIDFTGESYVAVKLNDEGVVLSDRKLPWHDKIAAIFQSNSQWWGEDGEDTLDFLCEGLWSAGFISFDSPESHEIYLEFWNRIASYPMANGS